MTTLAVNEPPIEIAGAAELAESAAGCHPRRLPRSCWHLLDLMTQFAQRAPSGVRVALRTDSPFVGLTLSPTVMRGPGLREPALPAVDLVVDGELVATKRRAGGRTLVVDLNDRGNVQIIPGDPIRVRFEGLGNREKDVELWLPPTGDTALGALEVADGARVDPPRDERRRWVHYGSSISQCSEATSPARIWPAVAARKADLHLISLGLGGSCHLDPYVARHMRDTGADLISLKLGINVVNGATFRERTFTPAVHGFLDTLRDGHPTTPIVVASPIFCPSAEERPGPTALQPDGTFVAVGDPADVAQGALTLRRIREILAQAVKVRRERGDPHLHYLDGLDLFGKADAADLPDDLHPNGAGYERMGARFYERVFAPGGLLG
jgi:hypothetical protein